MRQKPREELSKVEISNLSHKELKIIIIKMLNKLRRMDELNEKFNKELENTKKQTELKNTITEIKNTPEEINSKLDDTKNRSRN